MGLLTIPNRRKEVINQDVYLRKARNGGTFSKFFVELLFADECPQHA